MMLLVMKKSWVPVSGDRGWFLRPGSGYLNDMVGLTIDMLHSLEPLSSFTQSQHLRIQCPLSTVLLFSPCY